MGKRKDALTAKLTIRIPPALLARLQRQADGERRNLADFIRLALEDADRHHVATKQAGLGICCNGIPPNGGRAVRRR